MKFKSILAKPLIKPERDTPSLYRQAQENLNKKYNKKRR